MPPATRVAAGIHVALLAALIVAAGIVAIAMGQDANWDLQNYHFYNGWAWLNGRTFDRDLAAAQVQTYHNPLLDLPFYSMVARHWRPRLIAFVLAIPAGIGAFFAARIAWLAFAALARAERMGAALAATAIGVTGAMGVSQLGTTFNEWPVTALVIAAIAFVANELAAGTQPVLRRRTLGIAGLLAGLAVGLKLTSAPFALGFAAALSLQQPLTRRRVGEVAWFAVSGLCGFLLAYGWWGWMLWVRFDNPFFPYFNEIFGSAWWGEHAVTFRDFGPHTWSQWIEFPWRLHSPNAFFVGEVPYMDWRFAILYALALLALIAAGVERLAGATCVAVVRFDPVVRFLGIFFVVSFLVWTAQFSIARYTIVLELLSGILIVALLLRILRRPYARAGVLIATALIVATTRYADWWRIRYGEQWFNVRAPKIEPQALVILTSPAPMAYVLPFLPGDARYVAIHNSLIDPRRNTQMTRSIESVIAKHRGPLYALTYHDPLDDPDDLPQYGLKRIAASCAQVHTNMRISPLDLCRLERISGGDAR